MTSGHEEEKPQKSVTGFEKYTEKEYSKRNNICA